MERVDKTVNGTSTKYIVFSGKQSDMSTACLFSATLLSVKELLVSELDQRWIAPACKRLVDDAHQ